MMAVVFAVAAAIGYGLSDFVAGVVSRRSSAWSVAVCAQVVAGAAVAVAAVGRPGNASIVDLSWGAVAGVGNAVGTGFLYRGLASGRMSIVAPLSAVGAALGPVAVGLLVGERPTTLVWAGILAGLPGIWWVSRVVESSDVDRYGGTSSAVRDGGLAGLGFGVVFAALAQVPESAGMHPLLVDQVIGLVGLVVLAVMSGEQWRPWGIAAWGGGAAGALGGLASVTYVLSSHTGPLVVVAVLASFYPAVTILLAAALLRERICGGQGVGLLLRVLSLALVSVG